MCSLTTKDIIVKEYNTCLLWALDVGGPDIAVFVKTKDGVSLVPTVVNMDHHGT